jgi:hypothetical protein
MFWDKRAMGKCNMGECNSPARSCVAGGAMEWFARFTERLFGLWSYEVVPAGLVNQLGI